MMSERPGPAGSSQAGTDAEHECRRKRYQWQKYSRPGHYSCHSARHQGGQRGVHGVHEPEPSADKIAGQNEADYARSQSDNDLQHIEFRM